MVTQKRWKEAVREGRLLVLQGAEGRIALGRLAQEIAPKADHPGGSFAAGAAKPLEEFAAEIDAEPNTVREYRDVAVAWGLAVPPASWSVLRELSREDDPHVAFAAVKKAHGKVNILTVREWRGKATAGVRSTSSVRERAIAAADLLTDPEVAEKVMEDTKAASAISRASRSVQDRTQRAGSDRVKNERPNLHKVSAFLNVGGLIAEARRALADALDGTADVVFDADQIESLMEDVEAVQLRLDGLRSRLSTGNIDDALKELLNEGT